MIEEGVNTFRLKKPQRVQPKVIIKRQAPIEYSKYNSNTKFAYQFTSDRNEDHDTDQMIIFL